MVSLDLSMLITTTQAARILNVSEQRLRQFHEQGILEDVTITPLGRLFNPEEIEALRQHRAEEGQHR